jgi:hypothetical protein
VETCISFHVSHTVDVETCTVRTPRVDVETCAIRYPWKPFALGNHFCKTIR